MSVRIRADLLGMLGVHHRLIVYSKGRCLTSPLLSCDILGAGIRRILLGLGSESGTTTWERDLAVVLHHDIISSGGSHLTSSFLSSDVLSTGIRGSFLSFAGMGHEGVVSGLSRLLTSSFLGGNVFRSRV